MGIVREVFSGMDVESLLLGILFVIVLAVLMLVLSRIRLFQKNQSIKTIISVCIALLTVYGISKSRWNIEDFFYSLGFGMDMVYVLIIPTIIGFFLLIAISRDEVDKARMTLKIYKPFMVFGIIFIALKFTSVANGNGTLILGIPLLIIGIILWWIRRGRVKIDRRKRLQINQ